MFENFVIPDFLPAAPEMFLAIMAMTILMIDLFAKDARHSIAFWLAQLTLLGCAFIQVYTSTPGVVYTFSNTFVDDSLGDLLKIFVYLTMIVVFFYSRTYLSDRPDMNKGEYYVLALMATLGMLVMISANNFITVYVGLELLSLSLYALVAMNRDSVQATEAAMKYFVLGALASGLLLYGMSMIYGATGSLEITEIAQSFGAAEGNRTVLVFGLVFMVSGLAFKLGLVPFHMWIPDVYHGAPTPVTLLIGSAPKFAAFALIMRLLVSGLLPLAQDWQGMLVIMAVLSMAIGNLAAIAQSNIKRMLAYSAISHMGFMLLGIVTGVVSGDPRYALNAYSSAMFYVIAYVLMTLGAFGVILLMARAGFEAEELSDYKGLNKRSPWFAFIMLMVMFSMAGVPPFIGFFAKFSVLQAVVATGEIWLAVVAVIFSLIGAFYYLRVVKLMYFDKPETETPIEAGIHVRLLLSANGLAVAVLGIFPQAIMTLCAYALLTSF